ncbi:MAG TPA: DNA polymerase III subunit beta [Elusimicrobia bacterium]|nr:DNA polymerase III subunit beta [Elusimicrobiota bacterium]
MKINCRTEELSNGVQTIQSALSQRTTLPILLNFLMETEGAKLKLVSTDLQMGVKHYVKAEVEKDGSITIPAKKFSDILHTLPGGQDVLISIDADQKIQVKCGRSRFIIIGAPKSEYPVLPEFSKADAFQMPSGELADMVKKTLFAASTDETRYVLNGVFWAASGGVLDMVATDGRRLAAIRRKAAPGGTPIQKDFRVIVPTKVLQEFLRLSGHEDAGSQVSVGITENQVGFLTSTTTMISRLVEGSFPNYEQVIPTKRDIKVSLAVKDLLLITRQAELASPERGGSVKYSLKKGALHVAAASQTVQFEDEIPVDYKGDEFTIAFNPEYVIDGLKAMGGEKVTLSLTTPINPALFEPEGQEEYKYVIMPMRV